MRVKLRYLDSDNAARKRLADKYDEGLGGLDLGLPRRQSNAEHVYHLYVIRSARRDDLKSFLKSRDIGALIHYPVPVHLQPAYRDRLQGSGSLPETERAAREVLSLPIYPELSESELGMVIEGIRAFHHQ